MEFRLVYRGPLKAASGSNTRSPEKHAIRREFHPQLRVFWREHRPFSGWFTQRIDARNSVSGVETTVIEQVADMNKVSGYRFIPMIQRGVEVVCELDILFLRRDSPGRLIQTGGDIDNRLKVLFDALRMPTAQELSSTPGPDEDPFFVLLADDSLISTFKVTTDELLVPPTGGEHENDVLVVVAVRPRVLEHRHGNEHFA